MSQPDLRPVFALLDSVGIDLTNITQARLERGQDATGDEAQLLETGMTLLLLKFGQEAQIAHALELAYDDLRTKYAQASGRLALAHQRVTDAAVRHKDPRLAALARDTLRGEPKQAALARIPSAAKIRKAAAL